MEKLTIKGTEYELRNLGSEVTLNELAKISLILDENSGKDFTDCWLEVLSILGSRELVEAIPLNQFTEAVKLVQITNITREIEPSIEVNGRTYECELENGELQLSAKDMAKIENLVRKGGAWGNKAFAVVYKDTELSNVEHYADAHIKHKGDIFGEHVNADIAAPVIFQLSKIVMLYIESLANAESTTV